MQEARPPAGPLAFSRGETAVRLAALPIAIAPAFVLAALLILLGTQLAYVVAPRAPHYLVRLGLSTLAVLLGEGLSVLGLGARLTLGDLHPGTDLAVLVILQWAATQWARRAAAV